MYIKVYGSPFPMPTKGHRKMLLDEGHQSQKVKHKNDALPKVCLGKEFHSRELSSHPTFYGYANTFSDILGWPDQIEAIAYCAYLLTYTPLLST